MHWANRVPDTREARILVTPTGLEPVFSP
jgi:hypothetical protein